MRTARATISRSCNNACVFCNVPDRLDGRAVDAQALRATIDAARAGGATDLELTGGEPSLSAHVIAASAYARGLGLRTHLITNGRVLSDLDKLRRLHAVGVHRLVIGLHSMDESRHRHLVGGDPVAFSQTRRALTLSRDLFARTLRVVVTAENLGDLPALLKLAAEEGADLDVRHVQREGLAATRWAALRPDPHDALNALDALLHEAVAVGVTVHHDGFRGLVGRPDPSPGALTAVRADLLRAEVLPPSLTGGIGEGWERLRGDRPEAAQELAWRGLVGGSPPDRTFAAVADPVVVLVTPDLDDLTARSTLPGLQHALGGRARLVTPFRGTFSPTDAGGVATGVLGRLRGLVSAPPLGDQPGSDARAAAWTWLTTHADLRDARTVVVAGHAAAAWVRRQADARTDLRLIVLEDRALHDFEPGVLHDGDILCTPLAAHAALHHAAGVPPSTLWPAPWPVWRPHLADLPAPSTARHLLWIGEAPPDRLEVIHATTLPDAPSLRALLSRVRVAAIQVPPRAPPASAAWFAVLAAAGRAVVAPSHPTSRAHLTHGEDGLLVASNDRLALAAMDLFDDPSRADRLGLQAARNAAAYDAISLARALRDGGSRPLAVRGSDRWRPW